MTNTPRVFILEQLGNIQLFNAREFGDVIFLFKNKERLQLQLPIFNRKRYVNEDFIEQISRRLEQNDFSTQIDYVALSGIQTANYLFLNHLILNYGEINALLFNGDRYIATTLGEHFEEEETEYARSK